MKGEKRRGGKRRETERGWGEVRKKQKKERRKEKGRARGKEKERQ